MFLEGAGWQSFIAVICLYACSLKMLVWLMIEIAEDVLLPSELTCTALLTIGQSYVVLCVVCRPHIALRVFVAAAMRRKHKCTPTPSHALRHPTACGGSGPRVLLQERAERDGRACDCAGLAGSHPVALCVRPEAVQLYSIAEDCPRVSLGGKSHAHVHRHTNSHTHVCPAHTCAHTHTRTHSQSPRTRFGGDDDDYVDGVSPDDGDLSLDAFGRIYKYDPQSLFNLGFMYNLAGTVIMMKGLWITFLLLAVIASFWGVYSCPKQCSVASGYYSSDAVETAECRNCVVGISPSTGLLFGELVAFLLGLFDSMTFDRWWSTRVLLEKQLDAVQGAGLDYATYLQGPVQLVEQYRYTLVRYLNLAMQVFHMQMEDVDDFTELVEKGILTEQEWDILEHSDNKHNLVYLWADQLLSQLGDEGYIMMSHNTLPMLHENVASMRVTCGQILCAKNCQIPFTYTHLMTVIVKIHLLLVCTVSGTFIGQGFKVRPRRGGGHPHSDIHTYACTRARAHTSTCTHVPTVAQDGDAVDVLWGYLVLVLSTLVLEGLLRIHVVLRDPFGDDTCDFPLEKFFEETLTASTDMVLQTMNLPDFRDGPDPPMRTARDMKADRQGMVACMLPLMIKFRPLVGG